MCGVLFLTRSHSNHQLEYKLKTWGFRKKLPKNIGSVGWQYIGHQVNKRELEGKETQVIHSGRILDAQTVRREIMRHSQISYGKGDHMFWFKPFTLTKQALYSTESSGTPWLACFHADTTSFSASVISLLKLAVDTVSGISDPR